jgi:hypothetical protein
MAAPKDERIAAATAATIGVESVADTYGGDWYGQTAGWADELPDLSDDDSDD